MMKFNAKRRCILFDLDKEDYSKLVSTPCFYCGGPLPETGGGLDRIKNEVGYVSGNVRPCCDMCNRAKLAHTESEFKEWSLRLFNYWSSK